MDADLRYADWPVFYYDGCGKIWQHVPPEGHPWTT